jgi:hypothetical protein
MPASNTTPHIININNRIRSPGITYILEVKCITISPKIAEYNSKAV